MERLKELILAGIDVVYPSRMTLFHYNSIVLAGGALSATVNSAYIHAFSAEQASPAQNDSWYQTVALRAGTYTLKTLAITTSASGILTLAIYGSDGTLVDTATAVDLYSAVTANNVVNTDTGIVLPADDLYTIVGTLASKNASSSGYLCKFVAIDLYRTGD